MVRINKFKYDPMTENRARDILNKYENEPIMDYIKELWELIRYQKAIIAEQRIEIIGQKHKNAWKIYDKEN